MRLFNLSLRYKLPLWGGALIVATALTLSTSFAVQAWDNLKQDLLKNAEDLGRSMSRSLFPILLHDEVWRAFETVSLPFQDHAYSALAESLVVIDNTKRIYVSSHPEQHPILSELASLGPDFLALNRALPTSPEAGIFTLDSRNSERIFVAVPIANDGVRLGTLIVAYNKSLLWQRFAHLADRALWITLLVLGVLLPFNWYWGTRMMAPMRLVAQCMSGIGGGEMPPLDPGIYPYQDEIGMLYLAYEKMVSELQEKASFQQEVLKTERMAAVGRLTASIAHEINNPLGGMLNAISTLKRHGSPDPLTQKTISLLERGLSQIRETVAALLVEAKVKSRSLTSHDLEDVRLLVSPEAHKQQIDISWAIVLPETLLIPSTLVRQVLINLCLNAIQAANEQGKIAVRAVANTSQLTMVVENDGKPILPAQMARLFEPFTRFSEHGNGLGLWICYQIVTQLGGSIRAESTDELTRFTVALPLDKTYDSNTTPNLPD
jgi:signal transduction histidine kinase